jgi:prepilin signal peptidase PulO-like enzyme (type II secretory pathway)
MLDLVLVPLVVLLGLLVGGLIAGVAARLPVLDRQRGTGFAPRCLLTGQPRTWVEALPVAGYWVQRGRCRHCGLHLPRWMAGVELSMGAIALVAYAVAGPTPRFLVYLAEAAVLILLTVMDWRRHEVYTVVVLAGVVVALIGGAVLPEIGLGGALAGGFVGGLLMLLLYGVGRWLGQRLYGKEGLAFGDVELGVVIGLMCGFPAVVPPLFWGPVLGGVIALVLLLTGKKGLRDYFPYGPGLCLAALAFVLLHTGTFPVWDTLRLTVLSDMASLIGQIVTKLARRLVP